MRFPKVDIQIVLIYFSVFLTDEDTSTHSLFRQVRKCFESVTAEEDHTTNPTACNCMSAFYNKNGRLLPSVLAFPSSSRLSGAFFSSRPADRAGSVVGMTSSTCHTAAEASCALCAPNSRLLGNLFVHTWTVNQHSTLLSCRGFLFCGKCLSMRFVFHC